MSLIHIHKEYLLKLRRICVHEPYIMLVPDICPMMKHYIKLLDDITFKDGSYHTYYGDVKTMVNSYTKYWTATMDEAIKASDKCTHSINKDELLAMIEKTIESHKLQETQFMEAISEFDSPTEKDQYDELKDKYVICMMNLNSLKEDVHRLNKKENINAFAEEHFSESLQKMNKIFTFTCDFIAIKLSLAVDKIKISIEEILKRVRNNVRYFQEQNENSVSELLLRLYEKNKENLILSRLDMRSSAEIAEVKRSMDIIIDKIGDFKNSPSQRLDDEYKYWKKLFEELELIKNTIKKVDHEEKNLLKQETFYASAKALEDSPKYKEKSLEEKCEKFKQKMEHIRELKLKAARALLTFFSVKGENRIHYTDNIGTYYVDEFGHQVYAFDYELYHVNCQGEFIKKPDNEIYYYDENGRYTVENDRKLYKIQACTSQYEMKDEAFVKHTMDCGHSEKLKEKCRMQVKDPNDVVILPAAVPIDIKGTLEPEVIKYLWDAFGHILPDALHDVMRLKPKNPIHCLAHKLLYHKYKRSSNDDKKKRDEAAEYRQKIYQGEIERALAEHECWRARQGRVRPEWDDHGTAAHDQQQQFIRDLNYYN